MEEVKLSVLSQSEPVLIKMSHAAHGRVRAPRWTSHNGEPPRSEPHEHDAFLGDIEPWMDQHGDRITGELTARHGLPKRVAGQILIAALYATFAVASADLGEPRRTCVEIANGAALWARGYAEALGWAQER